MDTKLEIHDQYLIYQGRCSYTENAYRYPASSLQLLHRLVAADGGGSSALPNSFNTTNILQENSL